MRFKEFFSAIVVDPKDPRAKAWTLAEMKANGEPTPKELKRQVIRWKLKNSIKKIKNFFCF